MYVVCSRMFFQLRACGEYMLLARREPLISGMDYVSAATQQNT